MKKFKRFFVVSLLVSAMFTTTVFAAPTVNELKEDKKKAEKELDDLEADMTSLMTKINKAEQELVDIGQDIIEAEEDLAKAEENEKSQYEAMKVRIVAMYENGNGSMLKQIFEAGSFAEMVKQAENIKTIHEYDRIQLQEYIETKEKIANLKTSLENNMAAIEKKQAQYDKDKKSLDKKIAKMKDKIDNYDDKIQDAVRAAAQASRPSRPSSGSGSSNSSSNYVPPVGTGGGSAIVSAAYKYLGVPYRWGGSSMKGIDCSGLVLMAHKAIGVNLPHYSGSIGSGGRAVSRANAQAGDVVCYSGHVGIYLGNGMMIHAPRTGDVVKVVKVYGSPWFRRYW